METFDFDYHLPTTEYPESGDRVQLGRSYTFTSGPTAPDQVTYVLSFAGMYNYWNVVSGTPDLTKNPKLNFRRLEEFYKRHRMSKRFQYEHPQDGLVVVTFKEPLKSPKLAEASSGLLEGFTVSFLGHP